jgi:uncharacterized membrane protein YidH (DUF202 family)
MLDFFSTKIAYADGVDNFIHTVDRLIINPLIYLLFGLAILFFLYGVVEFIINQANEEKKTTGKSHMIWGIIGITIMLGVWTILHFVLATIGVNYISPESGTVRPLPPIDLPSNLQ